MLGLGLSRIKSGIIPSFPAFVNTNQNDRGWVFDGTGDYLSVADHDDFSFDNPGAANDPFSFAVWLKRDSVGVNEAVFSKAASSNFEYRVFFLNNDIYCDTYDTSTGNYTRKIKYNISTTDWQHWVFTYDGSLGGWTVYLDGTSVGSMSSGSGGGGGDMENLGAAFKIGAMDSSAYDYDGKMLQAILWDAELTADEASYIYASGNYARDPLYQSATYAKHNNVIAWWPLDDSNGNKDHASTYGNTHNATANGNVALDSSADAPW